MPKQQNIYKVEVSQLAEDVALFTVTKNDPNVETIRRFCKMYNIPLDEAVIKEKITLFETIASKIKGNSK